MKRRLATITCCLLIGLTVNLGLAWGCVLWSPLRASRPLSDHETGQALGSYPGNVGAWRDPMGVRQWGFGWAYLLTVDTPTQPLPISSMRRPVRRAVPSTRSARARSNNTFLQMPARPTDRMIHTVLAGWPLKCLDGERVSVGNTVLDHGLARPPAPILKLNVKPMRLLPLRPRWGGMVLDSALFAAALWVAVPGPLMLRRALRRRRGQCSSCGYNLNHVDHDACPECGAAQAIG